MMFLRNKFLLFLLACTIANPCFGDDGGLPSIYVPDEVTGQMVLNQAALTILNNNIKDLNDRVDELNEYINTNDDSLASLLSGSSVDSLKQQLITLKEKINALDSLAALINGSGSNSLASLLSGSGADSLKNLLYNGTDSLKNKITALQNEIGNLSTSKQNMDNLINGSDSTSLAQRIISLGTEVGSFSQKLETLDGLIGEGGSFGVISQGLTDTTQQLSGTIHDLQNIQFRPIVLRLGCAEGYYVAKCGDINLDVNTILGYVKEYYGIKSTTCWKQNETYTEMRYLLHLDNDDNADYTKSTSIFQTYFGLNDNCNTEVTPPEKTDLEKLQKLRKDIFDTCISSSYVCKKCPDDGQTDVKTELILAQSATYKPDGTTDTEAVPAHWKSFNTIADCFTLGGSDAKGTFKLETPYNYNSTTHKATGDKCYYDY